MSDTLNILALSGSLRRASFNTACLRACRDLMPEGVAIEVYDGLRDLPLYDDDLRAAGMPAPVEDLRQRVAAADGLLIATPEYNHSVSGVLKNAIDWASRPPDVPLLRKPVALLGASMGLMGTVRAQYHLRDMLVFFDSPVLNKPEVFVALAHTKFDAEGRLTDEATAGVLRAMLDAFAQHVRRHAGQTFAGRA